jgi:hypothetical protein
LGGGFIETTGAEGSKGLGLNKVENYTALTPFSQMWERGWKGQAFQTGSDIYSPVTDNSETQTRGQTPLEVNSSLGSI